MIFTRILCTGLLSGVAGVGVACDLPPLVAIPEVAANTAPVQAEVAAYIEAMRAYTTCVQAELAAAGGEKAQPIVKAVLVQRNNAAVAEGQAVVKLFNQKLGAGASPPPQAGAPPAGAPPVSSVEESPRGRSRDN